MNQDLFQYMEETGVETPFHENTEALIIQVKIDLAKIA